MKRAIPLVIALLSLPCFSQEKPELPHSSRSIGSAQGEILDAARERMTRQNDAWFNSGDFLLVIQNLETLVAANPQDEESWGLLTWMYMNTERPDLQWTSARRFALENPSYQDAKYYEAEFLFSKKMYAKIPALLEPVIVQNPPPDANAFRFLAHSYNRMGYYQDSLRVWDMLIKINPKDGQAKVNRANVAKKIQK